MFIKLSFTTNTRVTIPFRILTDIINNQSVNSITSLQARFTSASYDATLTNNFDATNSLIIRTNVALNTKAHFAHWATSSTYSVAGDFTFILEQPVYDSILNNKVYTQIRTGNSTLTAWQDHGQLITGGTMASNQMLLTTAETYNTLTDQGTRLTLGGNNFGQSSGNYFLASGAGFNDVRTFWCYITDKCLFWCISNGTGPGVTYPSGFPTTYGNASYFNGIYFQTQYTRYDYHNNETNGIWPVMYHAQRAVASYGGFHNNTDIGSIQNVTYTSAAVQPVKVMSIVSALPQVGSSWPKIYNPYVNYTFKGISNNAYGFATGTSLGAVGTRSASSYGGVIGSTINQRFPNATLQTSGFGMIPFGWENSYYGNHGGNATDQCGVYIFNGDFSGGDTFVYNNITYMLWPGWALSSGYRVGMAIPMV
jgi:hypothetical protein